MPHVTLPTAQNFISDKPTVGKIIFLQQTSFNLTYHFLSCYILGLVEALLREGLQGVYNLILVRVNSIQMAIIRNKISTLKEHITGRNKEQARKVVATPLLASLAC